MGNCCSNFVGDDDQSMELEGSHHINADGGFDMESSEFMEDINSLNASGANYGDMNFGEDAAWEMGTGATSYTGGVDVQGGSAGDGGSWVNQMSYFDGEVENGDEFDNFLTKRMRGRRKLRKSLRKEIKETKERHALHLKELNTYIRERDQETLTSLQEVTSAVGTIQIMLNEKLRFLE